MPVPVWLFRFEVNPALLPLDRDDAEGIARMLDALAAEYRHDQRRTTERLEITA